MPDTLEEMKVERSSELEVTLHLQVQESVLFSVLRSDSLHNMSVTVRQPVPASYNL